MPAAAQARLVRAAQSELDGLVRCRAAAVAAAEDEALPALSPLLQACSVAASCAAAVLASAAAAGLEEGGQSSTPLSPTSGALRSMSTSHHSNRALASEMRILSRVLHQALMPAAVSQVSWAKHCSRSASSGATRCLARQCCRTPSPWLRWLLPWAPVHSSGQALTSPGV